MNEASSSERLLFDLFDPEKGWPFSEEQVPLSKGKAPDGNPFMVVEVDGREVIVAEKTAWAGDEEEGPSPHRIVAFLAFTGVAVDDTKVLLQENLGTHGLPAWGIDDDGDLTLSASVLVGESIPLSIVRNQLLVAIGLIAETVEKVLDAVSNETNGHAAPRKTEMTARFLAAL